MIKEYCKNACSMKNKMYICIGKLVGIEPTDTYFIRDKALLRFLKSISNQFAKTIRSNASFCIHLTKIYNKMANWVKFGWSANKSNRVRFYGKTVIDGKAITSKKYRDAFSAIEWGEKQLNRDCTCIYCITVSGAHLPMNIQLF